MRCIYGRADFHRPPLLSVNKFSPSTAVQILKVGVLLLAGMSTVLGHLPYIHLEIGVAYC